MEAASLLSERQRYQVVVSPRAERDLKKLRRQNPRDYARVITAIRSLADNPRSPGTKQLTGRKGSWSLRVGDYRVIYAIDDEMRIVTVLGVAHRKEVYLRR